VEFRILGSVELRVDGHSRELGSPKERCVLAVLLWELGQPVSAERLIDLVWGENAPASAHDSLYVYISRLRKRIRDAAGDDTRRLLMRSGYYTLNVPAETVDLHVFRTLRERARAAADRGADEQAAELLRDAGRLWRGTPLAGLSGDWAERVRTTLEAERFQADVQRVEIELRLGHDADLVAELSDLAARHPFDETLVEYLMLALHRCGRRAEALEQFRLTCRRFADELGSEPSPRLRELHQRMLNEDPDLLPATAARPAPSNSLPRDIPDFTGRSAELAKLAALAGSEAARANVTVVAISGMAGVGKSTFAVRAAHSLSGKYQALLYLDLHVHDRIEEPLDPASGLGILLRTLGVPAAGVPATLEERATLWRTQLAGRRALIVLDDVDDPEQIRPLLPGAPGCLVLITSRRRMLGLPGTVWFPLRVLSEGDAILLFTRVVGPERAGDRSAVAEVVRMCGYLPLVIPLVASRLRQHPSWTVADLAAQLRGQRARGEVHTDNREVAAALELTYRYLTTEQQRLFRRLALHPGSDFSVHVAAALTSSESLDATGLALDALLDYHLLEEPQVGRYAFHVLIREYARRLALADDQEDDRKRAIHRMLDYYLAAAQRAAAVVYPFHRRLPADITYVPVVQPPLGSQEDCLRWVERERANLLRVVYYAARDGWPEHTSLLPHMLAQFLDTWGYWEDAASLDRLAIRAWHETGNARGKARALTELAFSLGRSGHFAEALEHVQNALVIIRRQGDRVDEAIALDCMGLIFWQSSRYREAFTCHEDALAIWREVHDRHGEADALGHAGMSLRHMSRFGDALKSIKKALAIYREVGDLGGEGKSLNNIGDVRQDLGLYEEALHDYRRALDISREIGNRQGEAITLNNIGNVYQRTGRYGESLDYYRMALISYRAIGDRRCEADTLNSIGEVLLHSGRYGDAIIEHQKALAIAHEIAEVYQMVRSLLAMGNVRLRTGDYVSAVDDFQVALELGSQIGDSYREGLALDGLGGAALHTEGEPAAREYWHKALELFERIGVPEAEAVRKALRNFRPTGSLSWPSARTAISRGATTAGSAKARRAGQSDIRRSDTVRSRKSGESAINRPIRARLVSGGGRSRTSAGNVQDAQIQRPRGA
jgi:DNA-binding SARP family transcriptional activator/tetratricopeptide (TPR) repeat protein